MLWITIFMLNNQLVKLHVNPYKHHTLDVHALLTENKYQQNHALSSNHPQCISLVVLNRE